jgi:hypothetical protein
MRHDPVDAHYSQDKGEKSERSEEFPWYVFGSSSAFCSRRSRNRWSPRTSLHNSPRSSGVELITIDAIIVDKDGTLGCE